MGLFLFRTDNTTIVHWETTKDPSRTTHRWLINFCYYNLRIKHRVGTELVDHTLRQAIQPDVKASDVEQTPSTHPLPTALDQLQGLIDPKECA